MARSAGRDLSKAPDRTEPQADERHLREIRELAHLLDNSFRIPVIGYRFGVDAILGLVPVIGDFSAFAFSGYIIYRAARMGAPAPLLVRMTVNALGDTVVGSIPVLGTVVDVLWKANARNLKMLESFLASRR
ncbi:MAG: DUF4112 domain-containing protein [Trueperaceae bacterium]